MSRRSRRLAAARDGARGASIVALGDVSAATAAKGIDTPHRPSLGVLASSGTRIRGGRIWDYEANVDATGTGWVALCERMLREDAQVASCMRALTDTLASAKWRFEPPAPSGDAALDAVAERAVDYCNEAFGLGGKASRLLGGFEAAVRSFLPFLGVGYRYAEEHYQYSDGRVWLRRYVDCEPSAHKRWVADDDGELAFIEQMKVGEREPKPIPAHKMVLFTLDRTGQNYEGRGLLRPCYAPWKLKVHALDMLGIGLERWGTPVPHVVIDERRMIDEGYSEPRIRAAQTEAAAQAEAYVTHDRGFLTTLAGVEFREFGGSFSPSGASEVVAMCDRQIAQAFLLGFLQLGVSDTGSRSVGEVQESFFGRAAVNYLDQIAAVVGGPAAPGSGTVGRLLQWNFGSALPLSMYPRLCHSGLDESPLLEIAGSIAGLVTAGVVTPTDSLEAAFLAALGAQPLADADRRTPSQRKAPAGAIGTFSERLREIASARLTDRKD